MRKIYTIVAGLLLSLAAFTQPNAKLDTLTFYTKFQVSTDGTPVDSIAISGTTLTIYCDTSTAGQLANPRFGGLILYGPLMDRNTNEAIDSFKIDGSDPKFWSGSTEITTVVLVQE